MKKRRELSPTENQEAENLRRIWDEEIKARRRKGIRVTQEIAAGEMGFDTQGAVSQYLTGKIPLNTDAILKFSAFLGISPKEIRPTLSVLEKSHANSHELPTNQYRNQKIIAELPGDEFKKVRYGKFNLSAGVTGFSIDYDEDTDNPPLFYQESWLMKKGLKAENLVACEIKGDSMEPGLYSGDTVLIDLSKKIPEDGEVSAVNYEGELLIKRMLRDSGKWYLQSDNPDKKRHPNKLCDGDYCLIIGRVVNKTSSRI